MTASVAGIGRAVARYADASGYPALYDVLAVRGFGAQRRIYVRYIGHSGPAGALVQDSDAVPSVNAYWVSAARFRVEILPRFESFP